MCVPSVCDGVGAPVVVILVRTVSFNVAVAFCPQGRRDETAAYSCSPIPGSAPLHALLSPFIDRGWVAEGIGNLPPLLLTLGTYIRLMDIHSSINFSTRTNAGLIHNSVAKERYFD